MHTYYVWTRYEQNIREISRDPFSCHWPSPKPTMDGSHMISSWMYGNQRKLKQSIHAWESNLARFSFTTKKSHTYQLLTWRIVRPVSWANCFFWSSEGYGCCKETKNQCITMLLYIYTGYQSNWLTKSGEINSSRDELHTGTKLLKGWKGADDIRMTMTHPPHHHASMTRKVCHSDSLTRATLDTSSLHGCIQVS